MKNEQVGGTHYTDLHIQPWDAMRSWMTDEQFAGFLRGNAIKYIARMGSKGSAIEDAQKAAHYIRRLIHLLEENE